jgi:hypothetical protein
LPLGLSACAEVIFKDGRGYPNAPGRHWDDAASPAGVPTAR